MNKKLSVSAFVSCYNEGQNIATFLRSLLSQKEDIFTLDELFIFDDGSTDNTLEEIQKVQDGRIRVFALKKRIGKSSHLNTFFKGAKGDVMLVFDADIVLDTDRTIESLVRQFLTIPNLGLVGGNAQQLLGRTFIERAINVSCKAFDQLRLKHHGGNNAFGANGCLLALSRDFARSVTVPFDMIANDQFLYFSCIKNGFRFLHERSAIAWYRSPSTLRDHLRQNKRFIASHYRLERLFGDLAKKEYAVSPVLLYGEQFKAFLRFPVHSIFIYILNRYCTYRARKEELKMNATWSMAWTTKEKIHG